MFKKLLYNLNLIEKDHFVQPFIYVNNNNKVVKEITGKIRWFEESVITCKKKELDKCINNLIEKRYSKYKDYIHIY